MTARLDGKIAIVTGAARGMGEAHARLFVAEGAKVVLTDVLDDLGRAVADDLGEAARFHHHDVSVPEDWDAVVAFTLREFGRVDGLVNNAAIHRLRLLRDETPDEFDRMLAVNLKGPFLGMQAVFEPMRAAGGGSIVNISSLAGVQPFYLHSAYSAAKYGLTGLTQVAAIEYGPSGIRVNSVHPGPIDTDMLPGPQRRGPLRRPPPRPGGHTTGGRRARAVPRVGCIVVRHRRPGARRRRPRLRTCTAAPGVTVGEMRSMRRTYAASLDV